MKLVVAEMASDLLFDAGAEKGSAKKMTARRLGVHILRIRVKARLEIP